MDQNYKNEELYKMPKVEKSIMCACMNMRRTSRLITQAYNHRIESIGIKATQLTVLTVCSFVGPVTISELSEKMSTDRTTLSRNLKKLEGQKLIEFKTGKDARSRVVILTKAGKKMIETGDELWNQTQEDFLKRYGAERWTALQQELLAVNKVAKDML